MQQNSYPGAMTDENISNIFRDAADFVRRELRCGKFRLYAYAIDGLVAAAYASDYIIKPITQHLSAESMEGLYRSAMDGMIYNSVAVPCEDLDKIAFLLVNGFCVVLFPEVGAIGFEVKTPDKRGTSAPEVENTVKGAKDAFVETVRSNTSYIRRHLRSPDLRIYETQVGRRSLTNVSVIWLDGITNPELVNKMKERLASIDIDGLISPSAVEEYVTGSRATAFPLLQYTERSDRFCQGILDGRVGLLVDGLPLGYLAPVDIGYLMNSPEDHSRDYVSASWVKILRYIALALDLLLPAVFIAMTVYHQELLPSVLGRVIMESKQTVPFSAAWETLGLLIAFELLQETGIHLPQNIGNSVSIIGGIVVGTAAAEAGILSPVALIAVSLAGICGFVLPNRDLATAIRVWRFFLAILASLFGLHGIGLGLIILLLHLASLKSLGVPYIIPFEKEILRKRMIKNKWRSRHTKPLDKRNQK
ncbi:MAG: spore germination protein [Oscillospiraceae bacterium]|nr:spore germination protein [Oscillospiraceae bacterium]